MQDSATAGPGRTTRFVAYAAASATSLRGFFGALDESFSTIEVFACVAYLFVGAALVGLLVCCFGMLVETLADMPSAKRLRGAGTRTPHANGVGLAPAQTPTVSRRRG